MALALACCIPARSVLRSASVIVFGFVWAREATADEVGRLAQDVAWFYEPKIGEQVLREMLAERLDITRNIRFFGRVDERHHFGF